MKEISRWVEGYRVVEPCVVAEMPEQIYHADPCPDPSLSSTMAKMLLEPGGPAILRWQMTHPRKERRVFDFGHAAHEKVLGRGLGVVEIPDEYLTASGAISSKAEAKSWLATERATGRVPLTAEECVQVAEMAEALLCDEDSAELLTKGQGTPEISMFNIDPATGQWMRGRIDFVADRKTIVDYKTTAQPVAPESWDKTAWNFGYHIQAAYYLRMAVALDLCDPDAEFVFIAQSKTGPYLTSVNTLGDELLEIGSREVDRALSLWDQCMTTGEWPRLPHRNSRMLPPRWVMRELENAAIDNLATDLITDLEGF